MPGVPSGKGCNACRKQKKKCDWKGSQCSRCKRLQIPCMGGGQQRYKFMVQDYRPAVQKADPEADCSSKNISRIFGNIESKAGSISMHILPSNGHTRLVGAFLEKLNPGIGVRYNLAWNFGDYLTEVPVRLGTNEALDAAADTLVTGYTRFTAGGIGQTDIVLTKYNKALRALRLCLDNPESAKSTETLCAVMLILICQMFVGGSPMATVNHAEGAAQILKFRGGGDLGDSFEKQLLQTLRGPLLFQALFCDSTALTDLEYVTFFENGVDCGNPIADLMACFSRIPSLMRRTKAAITPPQDSEELERIDRETESLQEHLRPILQFFQEHFQAQEQPSVSPSGGPKFISELQYCVWLRLRALGLAVAIVINRVRGAVTEDPAGSDASHRFAEEIVSLARTGQKYRPLGSSSLVLCLEIAWYGTRSEEIKTTIDTMHREFEMDFWEPVGSASPNWFSFERHTFPLYTFTQGY